MINRYLDSITTYAETMVDSASIYEEEVSPDRPPSSEVATLVPGKGVEPDYNNSR
jgi:hypothetical protein